MKKKRKFDSVLDESCIRIRTTVTADLRRSKLEIEKFEKV
jgi:hypothetical protein